MRFVAPQNGADARGQFARVEGLRQIIVGAQFQAHDAVHIFAARGQHQHRDFAFLPQPLENLEAVDARQHDIEHHQVDAGLQRLLQTAVAFVGRLHGEALAAQEFAEQRGEFGIVIDQQDVHG